MTEFKRKNENKQKRWIMKRGIEIVNKKTVWPRERSMGASKQKKVRGNNGSLI
jgi:putative transposon-encoded protein